MDTLKNRRPHWAKLAQFHKRNTADKGYNQQKEQAINKFDSTTATTTKNVENWQTVHNTHGR